LNDIITIQAKDADDLIDLKNIIRVMEAYKQGIKSHYTKISQNQIIVTIESDDALQTLKDTYKDVTGRTPQF